MRTPEEVIRDFVKKWLRKTEDDLRAAEILLEKLEGDYEAVGFHAQQSAEKFLKAFLVRHQIEFPKTHDITLLLNLVAKVDTTMAESLRKASALTQYGVEFRYPGDYISTSKQEAKKLLTLARKVKSAIQSKRLTRN